MKQYEFSKIGNCVISNSSLIHSGSIIGKRFRRYLNGDFENELQTVIKENVFIGYNSIVGNGSEVGKNTILDDKTIIESRVKIGENNLIIYSAQICSDVIIGNNCVIGGFIGEGTIINNNCRIFGSIVHSQYEPLNNWDAEDSMEDSPTIFDNVFIGFNAIISAPVKIGPKAYVCAGSIVSKDVPEGYIAYGINNQIHYSEWKGPLKNSKLFI